MEYVVILLAGALVFGACFLIDKGFKKLFRSRKQHKSGMAVRLNKRYGAFGAIIFVLGLAALFTGLRNGLLLTVLGVILILTGIGLETYYMSFGIYYDDESFLVNTFGKRGRTYSYRDIKAQKLYNTQGHLLVELHLTDGQVAHVQSTMDGAHAFMNHAFEAWLRQTGRKREDCPFHNPGKSQWFPSADGEE